jgi:hypothetical protein
MRIEFNPGLGWWFMRRLGGVPPSWPVLGLEHWRGENFIRGLAGGSCDAPGRVSPSWPILGREREGKKTRELVQKEFNLVQGKGSQHLPPLIDVSSSWAILQERE